MISHLRARRLWGLLGLGLACCAALAALGPAGFSDGLGADGLGSAVAVDRPVGSHDPGFTTGQPGARAPAVSLLPGALVLRVPIAPSAERADLCRHHDGGGHTPCPTTPELTVAFRRRAPGKRPLRDISRLAGPIVGRVPQIGAVGLVPGLGLPTTPAGTARTPLYDLSAAYLL